MLEMPFMKYLLVSLGGRSDVRVWRQNRGKVPIRNADGGKTDRYFDTGGVNGMADISGIVLGEGWRLEIEVKSFKGRPSLAQKRWADFIVSAGGIHMLVSYNDARTLEYNLLHTNSILTETIAERRKRVQYMTTMPTIPTRSG